MDGRKGVIAAERQGLNVTGTLGVFDLAAAHTLIDFGHAVSALKLTTFRMPLALPGELLNKHKGSEEP
jgi:predicted nucleic acid-binding protein